MQQRDSDHARGEAGTSGGVPCPVRETDLETLLEVRHLKTHFPILKGLFRRPAGAVRAVDDINLSIRREQWMGLVGESGCGKTTLGKTILRLLRPTSGHIYLDTPGDVIAEIESLECAKD